MSLKARIGNVKPKSLYGNYADRSNFNPPSWIGGLSGVL